MDPNEEVVDDTGDALSPEEVEREARNLGWLPENEFKGNKKLWVDAEEFLDKGKHLMPVLIANNKKLNRELLRRDSEIDTLKKRVDDSAKAVEDLTKKYIESGKKERAQMRAELLEEIKSARKDDDLDREESARDKLEELRRTENAEPKPQDKPAPKDKKDDKAQPHPDFLDWADENSDWYGKDRKRTAAINKIAEALAAENSGLEGREFLDECKRLLEEQESEESNKSTPNTRPSNKVEGRGNGSGNRTKGYADLPADAKRACMDFADAVVGPDKKYKTLADFQKYYATEYFASEA